MKFKLTRIGLILIMNDANILNGDFQFTNLNKLDFLLRNLNIYVSKTGDCKSERDIFCILFLRLQSVKTE